MQDHANGFQGSLLLVKAKNGQMDATEKASAAQRMGVERRYAQYRLWWPHTRPPGGVIELIASGDNVQNIVCHGTRAPAACAAVELLPLVLNASEQKGGCTYQARKDLYY
jgi:hypothetical protein